MKISKNAQMHLFEFFILIAVSALGVYFVPVIVRYINMDNIFDSNMASAVCGAIVSIVVIGIINLYKDYLHIKRFEIVLLTEMGLIAKALYHDAQTNNCVNENIKETFNVGHAIVHSVGNNLALLDNQMSRDVLEFHSLMKVLYNIHSMPHKSLDTSDAVIKQITRIIKKYPLCIDIITQSTQAGKCFAFWCKKINNQD